MAANGIGILVLAGSGEYTPAMDIVDRYLLERCSGPVVLIATSCAQEGDDVMTRWEQMGAAHFEALGVQARPLRIRNAAEADDADNAAVIESAGFIWFSGGSPQYLAAAFHQTRAWQALEEANRNGTIVAGASGGLGVLNVHLAFPDVAAEPAPNALGLAAPVRALAHFDRAEQRRPEFVQRVVDNLAPGQVAAGVDEDTALLWSEGAWRAMGHKRVVIFSPEGGRTVFNNGDVIDILPPPLRAAAGS